MSSEGERTQVLETVITGFNTDIEHDGVVYHVQTEDKGLDSPIILSLVYTGGAILASKRSPYKDLIAQGFSDEALAERLKRQHRLICAAIHSGRINDLKKMAPRAKEAAVPEDSIPLDVAAVQDAVTPDVAALKEDLVVFDVEEPLTEEVQVVETSAEPIVEEAFEIEYWPVAQEWTPPPPAPPPEEVQPVEESEPEEGASAVEEQALPTETYTAGEVGQPEGPSDVAVQEGLIITMLDDEEFYSGDARTLRVLITNRSGDHEKPIGNIAVSIKILGTTFRPLIYSLKTERDGVATLSTEIPQFTSGRAAVLVRAVARDQAAELRRIIHPGK